MFNYLLRIVCLCVIFCSCGALQGCGYASPQTLPSETTTATSSSLTGSRGKILRTETHFKGGTIQDASATARWNVHDLSLTKVASGPLSAQRAAVRNATYVEAEPEGTLRAAASVAAAAPMDSAKVLTPKATTAISPVITWATPGPIVYGTRLSSIQLNATANIPGTFSYSPGAFTVLRGGWRPLVATFTPTNTSIPTATSTVHITVTRAIPAITWVVSPITAGRPLSAAQLSATASTPGAFVYSPVAGTVFSAGTHMLSVTFTPTDATDYLVTSTQVPLTVGGAAAACGAPTVNLNPNMSTATIQSAISNASYCSRILFAAGTYNITTPLTIPCDNLQITGPPTSTPTAILSASYNNNDIFAYNGNCSNLGSISYLQFENTGAAYFSSGNNSNLVFAHNLITNLPSGPANSDSEAGLYFDGDIETTVNNIVILDNIFGDSNSCTTVFASIFDDGGYCAGIYQQAGIASNWMVNYNRFEHVEEGMHFHQVCDGCPAGSLTSVLTNVQFEHNYIHNWHRIGLEIQSQVVGTGINDSHNVYDTPLNPSWGTMAVSMACCTIGRTIGTGPPPGANSTTDNVILTTVSQQVGGFHAPVIGIEMWGGSQSIASYNYIGGGYGNSIDWGWNSSPLYIENNYLCAPSIAGAYIVDEENSAAPTLVNNTTSATCRTMATTAPTITHSGSVVTITDAGIPGVNQAISIFYTTDGSTPTVASKLYTGPFTAASGTVIKALGMWGVPPQPTSFSPGLAYVPSNVVTATLTSGAVTKPSAQMTSTEAAREAGSAINETPSALRALIVTPSTPELTIGGTAQLKAVAAFDDGSTRDVTSEVDWKSLSPRTVAVTSSGLSSGVATGQALLTASWLGHQTTVAASSSIGNVQWSAPIVINQGGSYSGNWQSTEKEVAAVTITTTDPVILQNAHLRSAGNLIKVDVPGADVTVRNSVGIGLSAPVKGQPNGVFLDANQPAHLVVENNYAENVRVGVWVSGYTGSRGEKETLAIRGNRARNLNGMLSNGAGGYLVGQANSQTPSGFLEFDNLQSVSGVDVGWNEVVNYPTQSLVSDIIRIYRSSGTLESPLDVHDTYLEGAYAARTAEDDYQGGGIETEGAMDDAAENTSAFTYVHDNQVVETGSYGIAFNAGHDNVATGNRVISNGLLADGTKIPAQGVGLKITAAGNNAFNNAMHDNLVGWVCWVASCAQRGYRRDQFFPTSPGDSTSNSVVPAQQMTLDKEQAEYQLWLNKTASAGVRVGPSF